MTQLSMDYDDENESCSGTYCTLRLFSLALSPDQISTALQVEPTSSHRVGELISPGGSARRPENHWHLSTKSFVSSRDFRRHVDWLLERLYAAESGFEKVRSNGVSGDIFVFWCSAHGQGGPIISVPQLKGLARFELDCVFDLYVDGPESS
jgi:Domain of unknown function (DUF4279)